MQITTKNPATITRIDAVGDGWTAPVAPAREDARIVRGSFREAVKVAAALVREDTRWTDRFFNDQRTIAVRQAGDGAFSLADAGASIHLFNPIDSARYVLASANRGDDADLLALVSRTNWIDLRGTDAAEAARLVRVPVFGPIVR
jgi:hypothetical protein